VDLVGPATYSYMPVPRSEITDVNALKFGSKYSVELHTISLDATPVVTVNMGPEEGIETLAGEFAYNPGMQSQIMQLATFYPHWRRVRGDGASLYDLVVYTWWQPVPMRRGTARHVRARRGQL
jgi:hypothetical protein